jgi:flagellar biosynthesis protein FlhF
MSAVLSLVRSEQGAEAVILSQRRLDDGVELMVASQPPEQMDVRVEDTIGTDLARLRQEVGELKKLLLESRKPAGRPSGKARPEQDQGEEYRKLRRLGLSKTVVRRMLQMAEGLNWRERLTLLASMLTTVDQDIVAGGGLFVLVGPTGSGKSTTIAKLAARYVLANGPDDLALVTMDTFGIAAHEQLRAIGRILKVPVQVVDKQHSLERVLHDLRHKSLVLVDTAGLSRSDQRLRQQMTRIDELGKRAKTLLVLPANSQRTAMAAACQTYKTANFSACILSKLDDTVSLGEVLSFCIEHVLPLAYVTNGQEVPDAIAAGDALVQGLLDQLVDSRPARQKLPVEALKRIHSSLDKVKDQPTRG